MNFLPLLISSILPNYYCFKKGTLYGKFDIKILKPLIALGVGGIEDTDQATGYMGDHFIHSRNTLHPSILKNRLAGYTLLG